MNFQEYKEQFEHILDSSNPIAPYNDPDFLNYTKLNWSRLNRWLKTVQLSEEQIKTIQTISQKQNWIVITEPWCGDAAHVVPFIHLLASQNKLISIDYVLRDGGNDLIDKYLTNGGKSIPKLIIRDEDNHDICTWGPRPEELTQLVDQLKAKNTELAELKIELQNWYNANKGEEILKELIDLVRSIPA